MVSISRPVNSPCASAEPKPMAPFRAGTEWAKVAQRLARNRACRASRQTRVGQRPGPAHRSALPVNYSWIGRSEAIGFFASGSFNTPGRGCNNTAAERPGKQAERNRKKERGHTWQLVFISLGRHSSLTFGWHRFSKLLRGCRRFVEPLSPHLRVKTIGCIRIKTARHISARFSAFQILPDTQHASDAKKPFPTAGKGFSLQWLGPVTFWFWS